MPCEQIDLMKRLVVDSPETIENTTWKDHIPACPECAFERNLLQKSLSLYHAVEAENISANIRLPEWDQFSVLLEFERQKNKASKHLRVSLVAAMGALFIAGGVFSWNFWTQPAARSQHLIIQIEDAAKAPRHISIKEKQTFDLHPQDKEILASTNHRNQTYPNQRLIYSSSGPIKQENPIPFQVPANYYRKNQPQNQVSFPKGNSRLYSILPASGR